MDTAKIGKFLKELRREKGLTQSEVADYLYVSSKTISRWENGDGMPDINVLTDIADFYGITVDELLRGERKTIKNNEKPKSDYENKLKSLNKYLFVSLGILSSFITLGIILGFILNKIFIVILFTLGIIISSILYSYGYKEIIYKLKKEETPSEIKQILLNKNMVVVDVTAGSILLLVLLLSQYLLLIYLGIIYFLIRSYLKKEEKTLEKFKHCLELVIYTSSIFSILFLLQISYDKPTISGMMVEVVDKTLLIYSLIDTLNNGMLVCKIVAIILHITSILGLSLLFIPKVKNKKTLYCIFLLSGIVSIILGLIEQNGSTIYYHCFLSYSGFIASVILVLSIIFLIVLSKKSPV